MLLSALDVLSPELVDVLGWPSIKFSPVANGLSLLHYHHVGIQQSNPIITAAGVRNVHVSKGQFEQIFLQFKIN